MSRRIPRSSSRAPSDAVPLDDRLDSTIRFPDDLPEARPLQHRRNIALLSLLLASGCAEAPAEWMLTTDAPTPTVFAPGVISSPEREYGITFSPDGREAFFTRRSRRGPARLMTTRWEEGAWSEPTLAPFAVERDEAPFMTSTGDTLFFSSRRPLVGSFDQSENIWFVERGPEGWSEPRPLAGTVNRPGDEIDDFTVGTELGPTVTPEGALLYWTRTSPDWGSDIYVAEPDENGAYTDPRPLRLNSPGEERNPAVSPDGEILVFQGYRGGGFGDDDLYVARRTDFGWSDPGLLPPPINSPDAEGNPAFSPDGRLFFFSSDRGGGYTDIYVVAVEALGGSTQ